ncbi:MAG: MBL fold metallo-hydrolase [Candidatus Paceibacterota bacterium]
MNKPILFIFGILVAANIFSWSLFVEAHRSQYLVVDFLNVGQGDSSFIKTPEGHKIIIDGGPDYNRAAEKLAKEIPFWDKEIDLMVLTHSEKDHFAGLFKILELYNVKNIAWSGDAKDTEEFKSFKLAVLKEQEEGSNVYEIGAKDKILFGKTEMDILFPYELTQNNGQSVNENCLVGKLVFDKNSFLFAGDISDKEEKQIITSQENIDADVLKVAHHGSKYSSSAGFLKSVSPKIAVIQVGKNTYGHPTVEAISRLTDAGAKIYRNDLNGDIKVISDGKNMKILSEN